MARGLKPQTISNDSASGSAEIERSLKFHDGDSANLTRTPGSAGNRKTFTYSCWFKRSTLGTQSGAFLRAGSSASNYFKINIANDHKLYVLATISGGYTEYWRSAQLFRDVAGWTHLVLRWDTTQGTAADRVRVYINGTQMGTSAYSAPTQDLDGFVNNTVQHEIGSDSGNSQYWDGYMAEVNLVDGLSLDPSSFGFLGGQTNVWLPRRYTGSYGTNGFRLDFNDNSSTAALGIDKSPNGNDFTPNNFSVSAGVGNDSVIDSPTNNFCTWNSSFGNPGSYLVPTEGNLQCNGVSGNNHNRQQATMPLHSGKWYCELKMVSGYSSADGTIRSGVCTPNAGHRASNNDGLSYENSNNFTTVTYAPHFGVVYEYTTSKISSLTTFANGDVMGIALDLDNDRFFVSKNGTFFSNGTGTQDPVTGTNPLYSGGVLTSRKDLDGFVIVTGTYSDKIVTADFGQQGFAYTPPTGFKAISSKNFVPLTPAFRNPKRHFDILTYTGTGSSNSVTGLEFTPDLIWAKRRNTSGHHHLWVDTIRGGSKSLQSNTDDSENSNANRDMTFLNDGIRWNSDTGNANANGGTYVAWCWKGGGDSNTFNVDGKGYATAAAAGITDGNVAITGASVNTEAGFSVVTYTGSTASGALTVGHGLGKKPAWVIIKRRDSSGEWIVGHQGLATDAFANNKFLKLDASNSTFTNSLVFDAEPTTTVTQIVSNGAGGAANLTSSGTYVMYSWAEITGYSKFGSYVGNGNSNGQYVYLGFRPAFILIKREASESWIIADYKRNSNDRSSPADSYILANTDGAESTGIIYDLVQNGVKFQSNSQNESGSVYYYAAFADSPGITPFGGATANAQ